MSTTEGPRTVYPLAPVATPDSLRRPPEVTVALWLTIAGAVLFLVLMSLAYASMDLLREVVREGYVADGASFTESDVRTGAAWLALVYYVFAVILAAPFITFAALARGGRNWARIILTVLVAIGGVSATILIFPAWEGASHPLAIRIVQTLLAGTSIAIILLVYSRNANQYFAAGRPRY